MIDQHPLNTTEVTLKTREWLILNAVRTWLYHYEKLDEAEVLTPQYKLLEEELKQVYEQSISPKARKRGRPAKRQRTKETPSNPSSTEENKATTEET
jgi:hypothetical protein